MNTREIEMTVANHTCLSKIFLGVFASDKLPNVNQKPACFIANTDPSNKPGQHWVAMYFDRYTEYFDSYGLRPSKPFALYKPDIANTYCLQSIGSSVCGEYCIYYLHSRAIGHSLETIVSKLSKRTDSDKIVKLYTDTLRISATTSNCQYCSPRK